jgi:transcriptional regulator with XRE-family HTH domain
MDPKLFGARLKELREQAELTQKALADRANISQRAVSHYEQGLHDPTWTSVLALATALGVDCLAFQQPPAEVPEPRRGRPRKAGGTSEPPPEPPKPPRGRKPKDK